MTYLSNYKKAGVVLLVVLLIAGMFATMSFAKNTGYTGGKNGYSKGDVNVGPGSGNGGYKKDAPDADGDGIPNGLDDDYISDCDCDCCSAGADGIPNCQNKNYQGTCRCEGEPQGNQWGKK